LFRKHETILKPLRPSLISNSLSNATRIPIAVFASIVKQPVADNMDDYDVDDEFYDAPDHFSDDDEIDDEQAPEDDVSEMVIKFQPLAVWNNSEDNEVEYELPPNYGKFIISTYFITLFTD
jgi:hypothetical protein